MKKVVKSIFLVLLTLFIFTSGVVLGRLSSPNSTSPKIEEVKLNEEKLWNIVNAWREENNLRPYTKNDRLCDIAKIRSNDPLINEKLLDDHKGFIERYKNYPSVIGENMAKDWKNEQSTLKAWIDSPTHLKNLQESFSYSCIKTKGDLVIQIFSSCENKCP